MRIVGIADTHGEHRRLSLPDGDVLVFCGDICWSPGDLDDFDAWLGTLPHDHKIIVAGNHDLRLDGLSRRTANEQFDNATYLYDSGVRIGDTLIYGSPWQPPYHNWGFNLDRKQRRKQWGLIPSETDILLTHAPPKGVFDRTVKGNHAGCPELRDRVYGLKPDIHLFGHIHESAGRCRRRGVLQANVSSLLTPNDKPREAFVVQYERESGELRQPGIVPVDTPPDPPDGSMQDRVDDTVLRSFLRWRLHTNKDVAVQVEKFIHNITQRAVKRWGVHKIQRFTDTLSQITPRVADQQGFQQVARSGFEKDAVAQAAIREGIQNTQFYEKERNNLKNTGQRIADLYCKKIYDVFTRHARYLCQVNNVRERARRCLENNPSIKALRGVVPA